MAHELRTEIEIGAPPARVWAILTDLAVYTEWNPFITALEGTLAVGERLVVRLEPPGGRPITFRPEVMEVEPGRGLEWCGRLFLPGLFDGRHRFELVPDGDRTRLLQTERFTGVLVPFMRKSLEARTRSGFEAMNAALKARAETLDWPAPASPERREDVLPSTGSPPLPQPGGPAPTAVDPHTRS